MQHHSPSPSTHFLRAYLVKHTAEDNAILSPSCKALVGITGPLSAHAAQQARSWRARSPRCWLAGIGGAPLIVIGNYSDPLWPDGTGSRAFRRMGFYGPFQRHQKRFLVTRTRRLKLRTRQKILSWAWHCLEGESCFDGSWWGTEAGGQHDSSPKPWIWHFRFKSTAALPSAVSK